MTGGLCKITVKDIQVYGFFVKGVLSGALEVAKSDCFLDIKKAL